MTARAVLRTCLIAIAAALLAAPLGMQQGYTVPPCLTGYESVVNTGDCVTGPSGNIVRNKVGKLMDLRRCTTYIGREYDEVVYHSNTSPASTASPAFTVTADQDVGEIAVIVDDGSIVFTDPAGTRIDTVDAVKKYMVTHADDKDFLIFFPNFNHAEGSFHNFIKNTVQGLNVPLQDNGATYETQNLEGIVLLRNFNLFPANVNERIHQPAENNDSSMSLLAQELGHQVAAYVTVDKDPTNRIKVSDFLLGRNLAHWCYYLDGPSNTTSQDPTRPGFSSMEGNRWVDNGNNTYTQALKSDGYSKIDQYLWGFRPVDQVGSFARFDTGQGKVTPDCAAQPFTPQIQTPLTISYPKRTFTIADVTRTNGLRDPDAQTSKKNLRAAFVIIEKQGLFPTSSQIAKVNTIRLAFETYFRDESGGGKLFTKLGPVDMDGDGYLSNLDCDEQNPAINPGAVEACNGVDDDCDGNVDDGFDADGDLYTICNGDCNDTPPGGFSINPGATEVWNGIDDNCDTAIDNVNLIDADVDGYYANPQDPNQADCVDSNPAVNPGAAEIVDGIDNNCNNLVDCSDPTKVTQSESGPRAHDGFDNDCDGVIDG